METVRAAANQKAAYDYIIHLSACTGTNIEGWDIKALFARETGGIQTDKRKINQIFFDLKEQAGKTPENLKRPGILPAQVYLALNKKLKSQSEQVIEDKIKLNDQYIESHSNNLWSYVNKAAVLTKELESAKGNRVLVGHKLDQALKDNEFFTYVATTYDDSGKSPLGVLLSTKPFVLRHRNEAASVDVRVPMPRYLVNLQLNNCNIRILSMAFSSMFMGKYTDGESALDWNARENKEILQSEVLNREPSLGIPVVHPHFKNGVMCLGNMGIAFNEAVKQQNFGSMLEITEAILTGYNHGNPYADIFTIKQRREEALAIIDRATTSTEIAGMAEEDETTMQTAIIDAYHLHCNTSTPLFMSAESDGCSSLSNETITINKEYIWSTQ